jgi:hypothetical protein
MYVRTHAHVGKSLVEPFVAKCQQGSTRNGGMCKMDFMPLKYRAIILSRHARGDKMGPFP